MDINNQLGYQTPPGNFSPLRSLTPSWPSLPLSSHSGQLTPGQLSPAQPTPSNSATYTSLPDPGGTSKLSAPVRRYFSYDSLLRKNCCLVNNCGKLLVDNTSNLERHLERAHPDDYALLQTWKLQSPTQKRKDTCTFQVQMSPDELTSACVEMVTVLLQSSTTLG